MQDDFPKIDLSERNDLDQVLAQIRKHAITLLEDELKKSGQANDRKVRRSCEETIDLWIKSTKKRLEANVTVNGMPFREGNDGIEPFDNELSQRVQRLSERCDTSTAEAIKSRKTIPIKRATLIQRKAQLQSQIDQAREKIRRKQEKELEDLIHKRDPLQSDDRDVSILSKSDPFQGRSQEVQQSLRTAVEDLNKLTVALVEQTSAANEQANFVKRLRIMSASYDN